MGGDASAVDGAGQCIRGHQRRGRRGQFELFLSCHGPVLRWNRSKHTLHLALGDASKRSDLPSMHSGAQVYWVLPVALRPHLETTNVLKRRRLDVDFEELKKTGVVESAVLAEGADDGSENDFIWYC